MEAPCNDCCYLQLSGILSVKAPGVKGTRMAEIVKKQEARNTRVSMEISSFRLPPSGDILVLGHLSPMGPEAAKRMLDSVAPGQFEYIAVDDDIVSAMFIRMHLTKRVVRESLVRAVVEEAQPIMGADCMLAIKCDVTISVGRTV